MRPELLVNDILRRVALGTRMRGALGTRVKPDTIGCVWTGEFDLNTLRVGREIFESGKKKLRIQKYSNTCGHDLKLTSM